MVRKKKQEEPQEELFQLTCTRRQMELIVESLDCFSRLRAGQIEQALYWPLLEMKETRDYSALRGALQALKRVAFPQDDLNESDHGRKGAWELFDLIQTIRNGLSWSKNPEGGQGVSYSEPLMFSKEPHPYIFKFENGEAKRIRNELNHKYFLREEFKGVVETADLQDALEKIKKWKRAYEEQAAAMKEAAAFFGQDSYAKIMESFKTNKGRKFRAGGVQQAVKLTTSTEIEESKK